MASMTHGTTEDGYDCIRLRNTCMSLSVLPELGGKIAGLTDLRSGRDWLWTNPHLARLHPQPGMDYERELDSGGWDEILFSVKPCNIRLADGREVSIGDHGNAIYGSWDIVASEHAPNGDLILEMRFSGQGPAFELRRKIAIDVELPRVHIEYSLSNLDRVEWPWMWCAHPLVAIEPGMSIRLPGGQAMCREKGNGDCIEAGHWPELNMDDGTIVDL